MSTYMRSFKGLSQKCHPVIDNSLARTMSREHCSHRELGKYVLA